MMGRVAWTVQKTLVTENDGQRNMEVKEDDSTDKMVQSMFVNGV